MLAHTLLFCKSTLTQGSGQCNPEEHCITWQLVSLTVAVQCNAASLHCASSVAYQHTMHLGVVRVCMSHDSLLPAAAMPFDQALGGYRMSTALGGQHVLGFVLV
jgi:hypothetical protein